MKLPLLSCIRPLKLVSNPSKKATHPAKRQRCLSDAETRVFACALLKALSHLHSLGIVHGEVQCAHVFLMHKLRPAASSPDLLDDFPIANLTHIHEEDIKLAEFSYSFSISCSCNGKLEDGCPPAGADQLAKDVEDLMYQRYGETVFLMRQRGRCYGLSHMAPEVFHPINEYARGRGGVYRSKLRRPSVSMDAKAARRRPACCSRKMMIMSPAYDIWSLECTVAHMSLGSPPFGWDHEAYERLACRDKPTLSSSSVAGPACQVPAYMLAERSVCALVCKGASGTPLSLHHHLHEYATHRAEYVL